MVAHRPHAARTVMAEAADAARLDLSEQRAWSSCSAGRAHAAWVADAEIAFAKADGASVTAHRFFRREFLAEP
jgi:hypothetical protein